VSNWGQGDQKRPVKSPALPISDKRERSKKNVQFWGKKTKKEGDLNTKQRKELALLKCLCEGLVPMRKTETPEKRETGGGEGRNILSPWNGGKVGAGQQRRLPEKRE